MTLDEKLQLEKEFAEISGRLWSVKGDIPRLFHYTNAKGLRGILKSNSLWATRFDSLDDPTEMLYANERAHDMINALVRKSPHEKVRFLLGVVDLLDKAIGDRITPYLVSFCDAGDLLSQWTDYGDRGSGFSIEFDFRELSSCFGDGTSVLDVRYNPRDQSDVLSATFEEYWRLFQRWTNRPGERFALTGTPERSLDDHFRRQFVSLLLVEFAAFKNPGYEEEREWRLFRLGEGESSAKLREGRFAMVPYIEFKPPNGQRLPITKIFLGPKTERLSARRSVETLLKDLGYVGVEVCEAEEAHLGKLAL